MLAAGAALAAVLAFPATAAAESCVYDAAAKTITASITAGSEATVKVMPSGELRFGLVPVACGGATTTNTDTITVNGTTGTNETLTVDMSDGFLGPGYSPEFNEPEIEMVVNMGDTSDDFVVIGTAGDDFMAAGLAGFSFNLDGDLDVTFSPLPGHMRIEGGGGVNFLTARGGWGAGLAYPGATTIIGGDNGDELNGGNGPDTIIGGAGNDVINGSAGNDHLSGGGGDDRLAGGAGNDTLIGGPGADELIGGTDDDLLDAADGEADVTVHGGPGNDTAYVDSGVDPGTIAVETVIADPGPPPPPPPPGGACVYDSQVKSVTASIAAGASATLAVVGGEIRFGATPTACGGATVTNTDTITVNGAAGSVERIVLDQSGGAFAPGATAEATGISEIEIELNLGDASDEIVIHGTSGNDVLAVGTKGVALNDDSDVDITFGVVPSSVELVGGGGVNLLTARGGYGSGQVFTGRVTLRAGDGGDTLSGSNLGDLLVGGAGNDTIAGNAGDDEIYGMAGNDKLMGNDGNDLIVGGAGADELLGGPGDDTLDAADGEADVTIHGAQGVDTAYYDAAFDPSPVAVENRFPE